MIKIFHLDDDRDILEIGRLALELNGSFELVQSASSEDAVRMAAEFGPDVILLDVMLPGTSGLSILDALREVPTLREVPVIFMTARVQKGEIDALVASGAAGVISKPFDPVTLGDTILGILDELGATQVEHQMAASERFTAE